MASFEQRFFPYLFATIGLLILIWFFTHQINEAPVLVVNSTTRIQPGWTAVSNQDLAYSLNIPREWEMADELVSDYGGINTAVANTIAQFSETDPNLTVQTVAYSLENDDNVPQMALVVYQSERLNGIDVSELATFTVENNPLFNKATIIQRPWHIPQLHLVTDNSDRSLEYVCEMRYAPSEDRYAYLVALCATRRVYSINRSSISTLINSFQEIN